jgi:hypothetical protein
MEDKKKMCKLQTGDIALVWALESVSRDAVTENDKTGNKY